MNVSFCSQCGGQLQPETRFCPGCGHRTPATSLTQFARLRELYDQALSLDAARREAWIDQACPDADLRLQLREMLAGSTALLTAPPPLAPPSGSGRFVGPYRVLRELGRGGMGVVYLAARDDGTFHKNVALKVLLRDQVSPEFVQRFKKERQVLAALDHPNIARLLDGGDIPDGTPYYVMEYVEGLPIDQYCDRQKLGLAARIKLFQQVCLAVHYLHQNLVVHRDLKPSNIQVSATGTVKLLDFGIAKIIGVAALASPDLTVGAGTPMTPNYASPEQLSGATLQSPSDIYSLGVILYGLLTGRPPYEGLETKMAQIAMRKLPTPPSRNIREDLRAAETTAQLRRALMGELDSIVLKALSIEPEKRYQSAADLAEDLRRFLDGQPVSAHRANVAHRSVKLIKRKRIMVAVLAAFLMLAGFGAWQWHRAGALHSEIAQREAGLRSLFDQLEAELDSPAAASQTIEQRIGNLQKVKQALQNDFAALAARKQGDSPERDAILSRGVRYLDRLRETSPNDTRLALAVAETYHQLGLLQENTLPKTPHNTTIVISTYQKAVPILIAVGAGQPEYTVAQGRLSALNIRIGALTGGTLNTRSIAPATPEPAKPAASVQRPATALEASQVDRMPTAPPALQAEVEEKLAQVASRVEIAQQAIEPIRINLEISGQTLNAETSVAMQRMHSSLAMARRQFSSGNFRGANENLTAAEAFAARVLRSVGR